MICFAKPVLTEVLYIVHKEECSITRYMYDAYVEVLISLWLFLFAAQPK
jgi:hypothetical protein